MSTEPPLMEGPTSNDYSSNIPNTELQGKAGYIRAPAVLKRTLRGIARRYRGRSVLVGIAAIAAITEIFCATSLSSYLYSFNLFMLTVFGAVALNLLMGTAGLVSIGNAAFLAAGGFTSIIVMRIGLAFPLDVVASGLVSAFVGIVIGLPAVRLQGIYLALATLAGLFIITYLTNVYQTGASGGGDGGFTIPTEFASKGLNGSQPYWAWTLFGCVSLLLLIVTRLSRGRSGRAWRMARDHATAARALGIRVTRYRMMAFAISSSIIGIEGALSLHFTGSISSDQFTLPLSISYVAMVLIGGLDSIAGSVIGAAVVTGLPVVVPKLLTSIIGSQYAENYSAASSEIVYGILVMVFITSSPRGLVGAYYRLVRLLGNRGRGESSESAKPSAGKVIETSTLQEWVTRSD